MGKRLIQQRRGKGSGIFRARKDLDKTAYARIQTGETVRGQVVELKKLSGKEVVVAEILYENGLKEIVPAAEGLFEGQTIMALKPLSLIRPDFTI